MQKCAAIAEIESVEDVRNSVLAASQAKHGGEEAGEETTDPKKGGQKEGKRKDGEDGIERKRDEEEGTQRKREAGRRKGDSLEADSMGALSVSVATAALLLFKKGEDMVSGTGLDE